MRQFILPILCMTIFSQHLAAQEEIPADSTATKRWEIGIDLVSRYIWRGQTWGGNFVAAQPSVTFLVTDKFSIGTWATTNFQNEYYYSDGITENKGYQELDFGITYQLTDYLSLQLWDYYWPTFEKLEGVDRSYFNYGPDGVKSVDASLVFDFSDGYKFPFDATISTLVSGNDYRYDKNGENPTRNFTTYLEAGYTFSSILNGISPRTFKNIDLHPSVGAVLNNQAEYYTYADYDKPSLVNLATSATREFGLGEKIKMPLSIVYTHNASTRNTEVIGRDFVTAGVSFWY